MLAHIPFGCLLRGTQCIRVRSLLSSLGSMAHLSMRTVLPLLGPLLPLWALLSFERVLCRLACLLLHQWSSLNRLRIMSRRASLRHRRARLSLLR